jgi:hypothetical protein
MMVEADWELAKQEKMLADRRSKPSGGLLSA